MTSNKSIILTTVVLFGITAGTLLYVFKLRGHRRRRQQQQRVARVSKLIIYPIKSLPGIEVSELKITRTGVEWGPLRDRSWVLVNKKGTVVTLRQEPTLALLRLSMTMMIDNGDNELWIDGPDDDMPTLKLPVAAPAVIANQQQQQQSPETITVFQPTDGWDCGPEVAKWFNRYLNKPSDYYRLMQHSIADCRLRDGSVIVDNNRVVESNDYPIIYHDEAPILVITQQSIDKLNAKLAENNDLLLESPTSVVVVSYKNFRPNILLDNCQSAHVEDSWSLIDINGCRLVGLLQCKRCTITTINQTAVPLAKFKGNEPLTTMKSYRLMADQQLRDNYYGKTPMFGMYFGIKSVGQIALCDWVESVY